MQSRMKNPAMLIPDAMAALQAIAKVATRGGVVPARTLELVHLRASQINGCGVCVDMHTQKAKKGGDGDGHLLAVSAWRDTPYFTDAERAALALTEATTRLADRSDPVPDAIWEEAARHFDERGLAELVLSIALANFWNRLNVPTRQIAGATSW